MNAWPEHLLLRLRRGLTLLALSALVGGARAQTVGTVTTNGLFEPYGVAVDLTTNLYYVTDSANNRIVRFNPATGDTASLANLAVSSPAGIVVARGGLVVADSANHQLRLVSPGGAVSSLAGGAPGFADGPAAGARFNYPVGLASDTNGNIYIADSKNNAVRKLDTNNIVSTLGTNFNEPAALVIGDSGRLYVADTRSHVIRVIGPGGNIRLVAGSPGIAGAQDGSAALFNQPRGLLWVGGAIGLLVSDTGNNTLRSLIPQGTGANVTTLAGLPGAAGYADGSPGNARFNSPVGLARDADGVILIADLYNGAVRAFLQPTAPPPLVLPASGSYSNSISLTVTSATPNATFYYTLDGTVPGPLSPAFPPALSLSSGPANFQVRAASPDFTTSAAVGAAYSFFVNPLQVSTPGGTFNNQINLTISTLTSNATIRFTTDSAPPTTNSASWTNGVLSSSGVLLAQGFRDGFSSSPLISNQFNFLVSTPVVAPAGTNANNAVLVKLSSATTNALFFWTIDGSDPSRANGIPETNGSSFILATNGTLKVIAVRDGFTDSQIIADNFSLKVADPIVSPAGTNSNNSVLVRLTSATTNALFYWTIDGSDPSRVNGVLQTNGGSFILATNGTLKVIAVRDGFTDSQIVANNFNLKVADPTVSPTGTNSNNSVLVRLTSATTNALFYWTIDGSDPSRGNGVLQTNGASFTLATNGTLKVIAVRDGFTDSQIVANSFSLKVADPIISPAGTNSNNSVLVRLTSATTNALFYWTIDGSDPSRGNGVLQTNGSSFTLATNGTLKVIAVRDGFADSLIVSNAFTLQVATPVAAPASGTNINSVSVTLSCATAGAAIYWTADGTEPSAQSSLYVAPLTLVTNTLLKVAAFRSGFLPSAAAGNDYMIQVDTPVMNPANGYFPDGTIVTLTKVRPDAQIFYTLNGQDPTTNDLLTTGTIVLDQLATPGADLRVLKARAFAPNTLPSAVVSGQAFQVDSIGIPRNLLAGVGSTIVVPVVLNLRSNEVLLSLQFRVQAEPATTTTPNLAADLRALAVGTNDFVPVAGPSAPGGALLNSATYQFTNSAGGVTNGLLIAALGTNANFVVKDFGTVAMLAVSLPANARPGDSYRIEVLQASGATNGQQGGVTLNALPPRTITVSNVAYTVGDTAPGRWYNAGDFGDGDLNNSDVNNAFYASLGVRVPYPFSDAFDAMDAFPEDTADEAGGDGQIRFLDWQLILRRSLRLDTNNWRRAWSTNGARVALAATLPGSPLLSAPSFTAGLQGQLLKPDARLGAQSVEQAAPGSVVRLPAYVQVTPGASLAGLQFRAVVDPVGGAPALERSPLVESAPLLPPPLPVTGLPVNQTGAAWALWLNPFASPLTGSNLLGYLNVAIPMSAKAGDRYSVQFANADGAPDEKTQYDLMTTPAVIAVLSAAPPSVNAPVGFKLSWFGAAGQRYAIESATNVTQENWTVEGAELVGKGKQQTFIDQNASAGSKFYRLRALP